MISTLSRRQPATGWSTNGTYVNAQICPSLYPGVSVCVFSGSIGALAWLGTRNLPSAGHYYFCSTLDLEISDASEGVGRIFLSKRQVEKAFGIGMDMSQTSSAGGKFMRRGRQLVFKRLGNDAFSIFVTDELAKVVSGYLEL